MWSILLPPSPFARCRCRFLLSLSLWLFGKKKKKSLPYQLNCKTEIWTFHWAHCHLISERQPCPNLVLYLLLNRIWFFPETAISPVLILISLSSCLLVSFSLWMLFSFWARCVLVCRVALLSSCWRPVMMFFRTLDWTFSWRNSPFSSLTWSWRWRNLDKRFSWKTPSAGLGFKVLGWPFVLVSGCIFIIV